MRAATLSAGFGNTVLGYNIEGFVSDVTYPSVPSVSLTNTSLHNPRGRFYNSSSLGSVFGRNIHYDAAARIDQMTNPIAGTMQWAYGYDPLGRLTGREVRTSCTLTSDDWSTGDGSGLGHSCPTLAATEGFSYDASGNRTDRGAVIVAGNRYQSFNNVSQAYDADGNLIQKYDPSRFNRQFSWSAENRLDSIVQDGWSRVRYDYNAFGQPVRKWRGDPNSSYVDRIFLWDGEQLVAEFDGNGNRVTEYVYLPGSVDQPFAHVLGATTPSEIRYHQQDALGNVTGTIAGEGVSQNNAYDSWGTPTISGNADSRLFWKGLMWEGDIVSLYYVRNRWYDPETGRFVSEDPIGHDGGLNLYAFGGNDPVNGQDPSGLCTADPSAWIDFTLRSAGQGTYTLTCRDLPPIIVTASSGGFSKNFGRRGGGLPNGADPFEGRFPGTGRGTAASNITQTSTTRTRALAGCVADHYGLTGAAVRGASWLGATPISKRALGLRYSGALGSSRFTNPISYFGYRYFPNAKLGVARLGTPRLLGAVGRANVLVATGLLIYDAASIAGCVLSAE